MSETVNKGSSKGKGSVGSAGHPLSLRRADVAEGAAGEGGGPGAVWAQHGGWARGDRAKGEGRVATAAHCPLPGRVQDVPYPALTSVQRQASPGMSGPVLCLPHSVRPCGREEPHAGRSHHGVTRRRQRTGHLVHTRHSPRGVERLCPTGTSEADSCSRARGPRPRALSWWSRGEPRAGGRGGLCEALRHGAPGGWGGPR